MGPYIWIPWYVRLQATVLAKTSFTPMPMFFRPLLLLCILWARSGEWLHGMRINTCFLAQGNGRIISYSWAENHVQVCFGEAARWWKGRQMDHTLGIDVVHSARTKHIHACYQRCLARACISFMRSIEVSLKDRCTCNTCFQCTAWIGSLRCASVYCFHDTIYNHSQHLSNVVWLVFSFSYKMPGLFFSRLDEPRNSESSPSMTSCCRSS